MADALAQNPMMCRYFRNGGCREGSNCRYKHAHGSRTETSSSESGSSQGSSSSLQQCKFFKQGLCRFGNRCRFVHSTNNQLESSSPEATSNCSLADKNFSIDTSLDAEEWVNAPEFVPFSANPSANASFSMDNCASGTTAPLSYAQAVNPNSGQNSSQASFSSQDPLCPYAEATGICKRTNCTYLHGEICDMCSKPALHPYNEELRKKHTNACMKQHEINMELSFAIQRSREKSCGVCFETIMEKSSHEQRFGILPNCNHCFCLTCIRKWRKAKQFDNKIIRACPECRVPSDFVCPSVYWVDTKEDKDKLITDYKDALSTKDCKYFNKGSGKCPFGNKCFYMHALPDGTKTDVGPPVRHRRNGDNELDLFHQLLLWDFVDERDNFWMYMDDLQDIVNIVSDSDDSDWSEYDLYLD
ncbi:probable E3 ubiquitin-protein ligase makorin-1 isoform X1 [Copidosoma floridanum]|uniref:probable E3 ubiquitin-protein ligase makorin-1 isoform X1 n=1 Tax=Copidosoma floridanum TaxID=29053 RepID=UPI0006C9E331|nr:probable E3 ubiquitin-protein ligase makorin-1 isoform X1 [Copidosoma floridanum]XP_023246398.1 probable E3 ubiquitin-protein ligase makorin-1 isoform X1 [Copidosoma floridanum]